ncbi:MAG: deoxyuridine 5'-triphosphate nucleotidohydrolase [Dictyoglomus sp. NZ13-RE01]|nr:MAG: deoxyuridine 5'-triphosphate nucleotidohydrolase [Dictyoglomus sp. NZ13-RE01]
MEKVEVLIERLDKNLPLPFYATEGASALDLFAREDFILPPFNEINGGIIVPTGIRIALPLGFLALVLPRSGLSAKEGITVLNTPGLIDSDYRGEILVNLINFSNRTFYGKRGMRIAQLLILSYPKVLWKEMDKLPETERGERGLGSTGI